MKMLINKNTYIYGTKTVLIPYQEKHVEKYHQWMQSESLQTLTASEPLTLEQEYEMQKSWMMDETKCTFIVLDRKVFDETGNDIAAMIGDTNLFFTSEASNICAEAEIMIAEETARGKKCGWEAMILMLLYAITNLNVKEFISKISYDNEISRNMFTNMGFTEMCRNDVFQEVTYCKPVDNLWTSWLRTAIGPFQVKEETFL